MSQYWPTATEGRIPTKNKMGFMFLEITGTSIEFIQHAHLSNSMVLDLGCAYGIVALKALQQSHCQVTAFDLSKEHLDILNDTVSQTDAKRLTTIHGRFPDDFTFTDNSLGAIHSSYMFHFLTGKETEIGLHKCFKTLKSGGKLYINTVSVYFKTFEKILAIYEEKFKADIKWPGEIFDLKAHIPKEDIPYSPDFIHAHKAEDFENLLARTGFIVEKFFYYDVKEPAWFASNGKGLIGAIATKP